MRTVQVGDSKKQLMGIVLDNSGHSGIEIHQ